MVQSCLLLRGGQETSQKVPPYLPGGGSGLINPMLALNNNKQPFGIHLYHFISSHFRHSLTTSSTSWLTQGLTFWSRWSRWLRWPRHCGSFGNNFNMSISINIYIYACVRAAVMFTYNYIYIIFWIVCPNMSKKDSRVFRLAKETKAMPRMSKHEAWVAAVIFQGETAVISLTGWNEGCCAWLPSLQVLKIAVRIMEKRTKKIRCDALALDCSLKSANWLWLQNAHQNGTVR